MWWLRRLLLGHRSLPSPPLVPPGALVQRRGRRSFAQPRSFHAALLRSSGVARGASVQQRACPAHGAESDPSTCV
eukprot:10700892-Alexandrium_andersonii.AAC.1